MWTKARALLLIAFLALASCTGEILEDPAPVIQLEAAGPSTVVELRDSIYMRISFYDADGDLGENLTNENNLFVVDTRLNLAHEFRISQLVPGGAAVPIQGELEWTLPGVYRLDENLASEEVVYEIYLVDRAGHQSNTLTTPAFTIVP